MELPTLEYIKKLADGNTAFENKLLETMKAEFQEEKETYFLLLANGKHEEVSNIVHKIKHKIALLSLEKGYEIATNYEEDIKKQNTNLQLKFQEILNSMTDFLNQINQ
ncbi:Hpt domain-containing protein [Bizionia sediminis]|uniref:Hpt domain-containing protein n=1 Tax=Bizionia sediminis TaxID=1737064 RepID=A0ABW5KSA5_9FLAO